MTEQWKPIPGYEGYYEVSDHGRVRSVSRIITDSRGIDRQIKGRVLSSKPNDDGYIAVNLYRNSIVNNTAVHRIVCLVFNGSCYDENLWVLHRNGVPTDNRPENLYWGTPSDNMQDKINHGNHHEINKGSCPRGHELVEPNLVASQTRKGKRECLSCARAYGYARNLRNRLGIIASEPEIFEMANYYHKKLLDSSTRQDVR